LYLARRNLKSKDDAISPHSFVLVNLILVSLFIGALSPNIHDFADLSPVLSIQLSEIANSQFYWWPIIYRSVLILVSADLIVRGLSMMIVRPRQRTVAQGALLFSFGIQPISIIVMILIALTIFPFYKTPNYVPRPVALIIYSLPMLSGLLTAALAIRVLPPFPLVRSNKFIAGAASGGLVVLLLFGLYVESIFLFQKHVGESPNRLQVVRLHCLETDDGNGATVDALFANRTRHQIIFSPNDVQVFDGSSELALDSIKTSLDGSGRAPYFVVNDGAYFWLHIGAKYKERYRNGSCIVQIGGGVAPKALALAVFSAPHRRAIIKTVPARPFSIE